MYAVALLPHKLLLLVIFWFIASAIVWRLQEERFALQNSASWARNHDS